VTPKRFLSICVLALAGGAAAFAANTTPFLSHALAGFDKWDTDHDGTLTAEEIELAVASSDVTGEDAAAVVALRRVARNKKNPVASYTKESIAALSSSLRISDTRDDEEETDENKRPANFDKYYEAALKKIKETPKELFVGGLPKIEEFKQGRLGTCFCLASLSALAKQNPKAVVDLFKENPDGTLSVTFGKDTTVRITKLTDGEVALASTTGQNGRWAGTYEKAVGQLRSIEKTNAPTPTPLAVASRGGSAGSMMSVLTGKEIQRFSCAPWQETSKASGAEQEKKLNELRALLKAATAEKRLMTAGTSAKTRKVPSLSRNHAYAVLGYDAKTDTVTLRDPHGQDFTPKGTPGLDNGYPVHQGIYSAPLSDVVQFMAGFAVQLTTKRQVASASGGSNTTID